MSHSKHCEDGNSDYRYRFYHIEKEGEMRLMGGADDYKTAVSEAQKLANREGSEVDVFPCLRCSALIGSWVAYPAKQP